MKTQKAREAAMRELYQSSDNTLIQQYSWHRAKKDIQSQKYEYKCFAKAYNDFTGKNLPNFLAEGYHEATTYVFTHLVEQEVSYDELCDFFEFTPNIKMKHELYSKFLVKYAKIVRDNTPPFEIYNNYSTTYPYRYIVEDLTATKQYELQALNEIMEIEEIKRKLPSDILYTPIEELLTRLYGKVSTAKREDALGISAKLLERMTHWVTSAQIITKTIAARQANTQEIK